MPRMATTNIRDEELIPTSSRPVLAHGHTNLNEDLGEEVQGLHRMREGRIRPLPGSHKSPKAGAVPLDKKNYDRYVRCTTFARGAGAKAVSGPAVEPHELTRALRACS